MNVIEFRGVSKNYKLGQISTGFFIKDLQSYWAKWRKKEDPNAIILNHNKIKSIKNADSFTAINDLTFSIQRGEVVGIIGRNGAGKSTLLKLLSRVTYPTYGEIEYTGKIASLLEVGTGFHPELTGKENIFLNGAILGMSKKEINSKFEEIVEFSGVGKFIDTPVKRYSSGMYVRLAFSVAAHLEPDILIIDEVLAVGDIEFQKKCINKMKSVSKDSGRTILFVSHNMVAVSSLCQKVLYLESGKKKFLGSTEIGISKYIEDNQTILNTSLEDRKEREGEGFLKFIETWTEDKNQIRKNLFLSGEEMYIAAKFIVNNPIPYKNCNFAFQLQDHNDYTITDFNTKSYLIDFPIPKFSGVVRCNIKKLPLMPGIYNHHVIARMDGIVQDFIITAGQFSVESGDYFGTGSIFDSGHGMVFIDHEWSMQESI